jgi:hypothetical protein
VPFSAGTLYDSLAQAPQINHLAALAAEWPIGILRSPFDFLAAGRTDDLGEFFCHGLFLTDKNKGRLAPPFR